MDIFFFSTKDESRALISNYNLLSMAKTFHFIIVADILILINNFTENGEW